MRDALQDGGQSEHRHQGRAGLREIHQGERLGADLVEEQRVHGALPDRRARERDEHQRGHERDGPALARVDAEEPHDRCAPYPAAAVTGGRTTNASTG